MKRLPIKITVAGAWAAMTLLQVVGLADPNVPQPGASASQSQIMARKLDKPDNNGWRERVHNAALQGDRSHLSTMIGAFNNPPKGEYGTDLLLRMSLLHSFAILGATEALPSLDAAIAGSLDTPGATPQDNQAVAFAAKVVKARLQAQSGTANIKDSRARAATQVKRFYQELGLTPSGINTAVASYRIALAQFRAHFAGFHIPGPPAPLELYAMRELADMIYHGYYSDYAGLAEVSQTNFALDPGAGLKLQLAPLSPEQCTNALIKTLSSEKITAEESSYARQLLADEGNAALPAINARVQEIKTHPEKYQGRFGLNGGLSLLGDVFNAIDFQDRGFGGREFAIGY